MAITVDEMFDSRKTTEGEGGSAERKYIIRGTDSETSALAALLAEAPSTSGGWIRLGRTVEPIGDPVESESWYGFVKYGSPSINSATRTVGESVYSFDVSTVNETIYSSLETVSSYPITIPVSVPNFKNGINVSGDGAELEINGVDILTSVFSFSETHYIAFADVDEAYKLLLSGLAGKINDAAFRGFVAKEVLFTGANGTVRGDDADYEITFNFSVKRSITGLKIGDLTGIAIDGWDYLWIRSKNKEETVDGKKYLLRVPQFAYVEKVYDLGDFDDLGI